MRYKKVPEETIKRLPRYLRTLMFLRERSTEYVTSRTLAEYVQLNPPQIRKDLSYFGTFGLRGTGYKVEPLIKRIRTILALDVEQNTVLVGAGHLGSAIARFPGFQRYGFNITDIYDNAKKKIGKKIGKIQIKDVANLDEIKYNNIKIGIIATPPQAAQQIVDILVKAGVTSILNLTSTYLTVPKKVRVRTVDLAMELGMLPYYT